MNVISQDGWDKSISRQSQVHIHKMSISNVTKAPLKHVAEGEMSESSMTIDEQSHPCHSKPSVSHSVGIACKRSFEPESSMAIVSTSDELSLTPVKKARRCSTKNGDALEYVTIDSVHGHTMDLTKKLGMVAYMVQMSSESMNNEGLNKKMNFVLVDATGVIQVTAWGEELCEHLRSLIPLENPEEDMLIKMKIHGFKIRDYSVLSTPPQQSLSLSPKNCTVELSTEIGTGIPRFPMRNSMYITDFEDLGKTVVPFVTNIRGIVHTITSNGTTQSGIDTIGFKLQDLRGNLIRLVAMGRYAEPQAVILYQEVVIFFVKALKPKGSDQNPSMWIYNDAFVSVVSDASSPKKVRQEIQLKVM